MAHPAKPSWQSYEAYPRERREQRWRPEFQIGVAVRVRVHTVHVKVFRKVLQELDRGDEGIDTGSAGSRKSQVEAPTISGVEGIRAQLGSQLIAVVNKRVRGWHRVVSSDGGLWDAKDAGISLYLAVEYDDVLWRAVRHSCGLSPSAALHISSNWRGTAGAAPG